MDISAYNFKFNLVLFLMSILIVCSSGSFLSAAKESVQKKPYQQTSQSHHRHLLQTIEPPITTFPTSPVTNPVTTPSTTVGTVPPDFSTPPLVTVPSANPTTPITFPPTDPIINPPVPVTNPVTNIPGGQPVTNPVTTYNPATSPVVGPPGTATNAPAVPGQSWCVARSGAPETAIQAALDYACGLGGADCSAIQQGGSCYNPNSLQNHASYAFNSYYQRNPVPTSCDFGGAAMITNVNPSSGSCVFTTLSSSSASPATTSPTTTTPIPTPTTESSSGATPTGTGAPPTVLNGSNPGLGGGISGYGESPLTGDPSSVSISSSLQPFIGCIIVVTTIITGTTVLVI